MIFSFLISGVVYAADITIKVDQDKKTASITSSLPVNVTLLNLMSADNRRLPLFSKLTPGKPVEIPLRFTMPESVSYAACEIPNAPNGYEKERDNYYHLSVEIQ